LVIQSESFVESRNLANQNSILNKYNISTKVNLPAVGENLQDQPNVAFSYEANTIINEAIPYLAYGGVSDFLGNLPDVNLGAWAARVSEGINNSVGAASLERLFQIQYYLIKKEVPDAETIMETSFTLGSDPSALLDISFWLAMPFSRGNVHIGSANPSAYPQINPNFFLIDFDLTVQIGIAKWVRKFYTTPPMSSMVRGTSPGSGLPMDATDAQWGDWIKNNCKFISPFLVWLC